MNLQQIDQRLSLFKQYLKYWLDNYQLTTAPEKLSQLKNYGWLIVTPQGDVINKGLTFEQWLIHTGHVDLVDTKPTPMYAMGVDPSYENGRFDYNSEGMLVWVKDPNGRWRMAK